MEKRMSKRRVIVIGTGAGGLTASAFLSRSGFDVVALERSHHVGGLLNPFERQGFVFNPGVHYLGQCGPGEAMDRLLGSLGLSAADLLAEMDADGYDLYRFPDFEVRACRGAQAYRDRLASQFPGDVEGVDNVFEALADLRGLMRSLDHLQSPHRLEAADLWNALQSMPLLRYVRSTFGEFLDHAVHDPRLKAVFAAPCGDYGLPPSRASAFVGLAVIDHYLEGARFPRGGSGALRDALQRVATDAGAAFRTDALVKRIEIVDGRAQRVSLATGETLEADAIVAAIDPRHVFGRLIEPESVPRKLRDRVRRVESSMSALSLDLGVNRDLREIGLGAYNLWSYPSIDIDSLYEPCFHGRMPHEMGLFISPNSLKDPTGRMAPAGKTSLEVVTPAPFGLFGAWADVPPGERGVAYHELKRRLQDEMLVQLDRRLPGVVEHVESIELSTPLAMEGWVGAIDGGLYGPAHTPEQSMLFRFSTTTYLPNLFLAGAGVYGGGILPCMQSGRVAARMAGHAIDGGRVAPPA
jgi:phytoene dehydrogenase-like protein